MVELPFSKIVESLYNSVSNSLCSSLLKSLQLKRKKREKNVQLKIDACRKYDLLQYRQVEEA